MRTHRSQLSARCPRSLDLTVRTDSHRSCVAASKFEGGSSKSPSPGPAAADEETSAWEEADDVAAELKAKRKAEREERDATRDEQREEEREER